MFLFDDEATTVLVNAGGGNTRVVGDTHNFRLPPGVPYKLIWEAGLSTASSFGGGRVPDGASVYRALGWYLKSNPGTSPIMRILGTLVAPDPYMKVNETLDTARSRYIDGPYTFQEMQMGPLRYGYGGTGDGQPADGQEFADGYGNLFLREMSRITGHEWAYIKTVQFF